MKKILFIAIPFLFIISCKKEEKTPPANKIIEKAITLAGGERFNKTQICFDFRGKEYIARRNGGRFQLERISTSNETVVRDVLHNRGFERFINDVPASIPDSMATRYASSVNSVHYFAYLPYGLQDKAVNKEILGQVTLKGKNYYKIKVTFNQEGGGEDFQDIYLYWIDKKTFTVDYLAYQFHVNGGGLRFRQAYNPRTINGIRFVDYYNFKPKTEKATLYELDRLFENGEVELLSTIALEHIYVQPCSAC